MSSTAIVVITTHGHIISNERKEFTSFQVPTDVIKYSETAPSVCSLIDEESMNVIVDRVILPSVDSIMKASTPENIKQILNDISVQLKARSKGITNLLKQQSKRSVEQMNYIRTDVRGHTTSVFIPSSKMTNKQFYRETDDDMTGYNNQIVLFGQNEPIDLLKAFNKTEISLSLLVRTLHKTGYKWIVLFDFSCSEADMDERTMRSARNDSMSNKAWGKARGKTRGKAHRIKTRAIKRTQKLKKHRRITKRVRNR
jgi:hypothetical protein